MSIKKYLNRIATVIGYISIIYFALILGGYRLVSLQKQDRAEPIPETLQFKITNEQFRDDADGFYSSVQNKDWESVYDLLSEKVRQNISKPVFSSMADRHSRSWMLVDYEVLSFEMFPQDNHARCVMRFNECGSIHYGISEWFIEDDRWRCFESGLKRMPALLPMHAK